MPLFFSWTLTTPMNAPNEMMTLSSYEIKMRVPKTTLGPSYDLSSTSTFNVVFSGLFSFDFDVVTSQTLNTRGRATTAH